MLRKLWGIGIPKSKAVDTLVLSRLLNPTIEGGHSLRAWGQRLRNSKIDFEDYDGGLTEEMIEYCKQDVSLTCDLYKHLMKEFKEWKDASKSIRIEHDIAVICRQQENNGFKLDLPEAMVFLSRLQCQMDSIESELQTIFPPIIEERWSEKTGKQLKDKVTIFNVGSRKQIGERLQSLGWKPTKFTEKGQPIVDEGTLKNTGIPEAEKIAEYLMLQKRAAMIDSWIKHADEEDWRVHGGVITNGAVTGRMTHRSPNLAQVPSVNSPYGAECRKLWIVDEGNKLVGSDLSGIELRCLAHYMQDDEWTEELLNGDIHQKNADAAEINRATAKTMVYALLYGCGINKLSTILNTTKAQAQRTLDNFYRNTPKLKQLMERVQNLANEGYVPGLDGRRILIRSEHAALNSLLQGCGAIIAKQWCIEAHKTLKARKIPVKQVAFVHDEIQIETAERFAEEVADIMVSAAATAGISLAFRCPVDAESKIGNNWFDCH